MADVDDDDELERRVTNCSLLLSWREREGGTHGVSLPELDHLFNWPKQYQCFFLSHFEERERERENKRAPLPRAHGFQWQIEEKMRQLIRANHCINHENKTSSRPRFLAFHVARPLSTMQMPPSPPLIVVVVVVVVAFYVTPITQMTALDTPKSAGT